MEEDDVAHDGNLRQLFEEKFRRMPLSDKLALISTALPSEFAALCLDPNPQVINALAGSGRFSAEHARLVARYHHSHAGLERITRPAVIAGDRGVQSGVFRNPLSTAPVLNRSFATMSLYEIHAVAQGREATEFTSAQAREALRTRFDQSAAETKVQFIINTEGRCLRFFNGLFLDKTAARSLAAYISATPAVSVLLVRNLLIFPSVPPEVVRAIAKVPAVMRDHDLRMRVRSHRNCPADAKLQRR